MTKTLVDIAAQLEKPFPVAEIDLLPKGQIERDGRTLVMGLPYADKRVYEDRLNELCPGEWSTPAPTMMVAGTKLIVSVTVVICGVPHSDIGEAPATGENAGTEAFAQGFKRACSQAGLGRFLYSLEKQWVPYDPKRKQIALDAAGIQNIVRTMYNKAHVSGENSSASALVATQPAPRTDEPVQEPVAFSMIDEARARWAAAYGIRDEAVVARWPKYLVYALGRTYEDSELTAAHLARLNEDIARQKAIASTKKAS